MSIGSEATTKSTRLFKNKPMSLSKLFYSACLLITSMSIHAQGFLHADGKKIVDGNNREFILRGMGLGGWMLQEPYMLQVNGIANNQKSLRSKIETLVGKEDADRFYDAWLSNHCTKRDI